MWLLSFGSFFSATRTTSPAIEDTGTAHLVYGSANVYLSPSFARSIDPRYGYQVFLTPGGDTRGLYVAGKYARGFTVREVQGGRSSFNFDYQVSAHADALRSGNRSLPYRFLRTCRLRPHFPGRDVHDAFCRYKSVAEHAEQLLQWAQLLHEPLTSGSG